MKIIKYKDAVQEALQEIHSVRQLVSSEKYMAYFIATNPDDSMIFKGFHLHHIEFYLQLRNKVTDN